MLYVGFKNASLKKENKAGGLNGAAPYHYGYIPTTSILFSTKKESS